MVESAKLSECLNDQWVNIKHSLDCNEHLDPNIWPSDIYNVISPLRHSSAYSKLHPALFQPGGLTVHIIAPSLFYPHLLLQSKWQGISCPECYSSDRIRNHGWEDRFRSVSTLGRLQLLKVKRFRCVKCPEAGKLDRIFTALDSHLMEKVYPPILRAIYPYRVLPRRTVDVAVIELVREQQANRVSFLGSSKILNSLMHCNYAHCIKISLLFAFWNPFCAPAKQLINSLPDYALWPVVPITNDCISNLYSMEMSRQEPLIWSYLSNLGGNTIKLDHTFDIANFGRVSGTRGTSCMFYSFLAVMNEFGEVIGFWFCFSKSLEELRRQFMDLSRRDNVDVSVVYTDNPKSDSAFLKSIFGDNVCVFRDVFHLFHDFFKLCNPRSSIRKEFMAELSNAFYYVSEGDIQTLKTKLIQSGRKTIDQAEKLHLSWIRLQKGVRKYLKRPADIVENLLQLQKNYSTTDCFKPSIIKLFAETIQNLNNGMYGIADSDITQHVESFNDEFFSTQGTSILESLHRFKEMFFVGCQSRVPTLHFRACDMVIRWNLHRARVVRGLKILNIYDLQLLSDISTLFEELKTLDMVRPVSLRQWKSLSSKWRGRPDSPRHEMFGALRAFYSETWYKEVLSCANSVPSLSIDQGLPLFEFNDQYQQFRLYTPILPKPVCNDEEKRFFWCLWYNKFKLKHNGPPLEDDAIYREIKNCPKSFFVTFAQLWSKVVLNFTFTDGFQLDGFQLNHGTLLVDMHFSFRTYSTQLKFDLSQLFLKSDRHLHGYVKDTIKPMMDAVRQKGWNVDQRKEFNNHKIPLLPTSKDVDPYGQAELDVFERHYVFGFESSPPMNIPNACGHTRHLQQLPPENQLSHLVAILPATTRTVNSGDCIACHLDHRRRTNIDVIKCPLRKYVQHRTKDSFPPKRRMTASGKPESIVRAATKEWLLTPVDSYPRPSVLVKSIGLSAENCTPFDNDFIRRLGRMRQNVPGNGHCQSFAIYVGLMRYSGSQVFTSRKIVAGVKALKEIIAQEYFDRQLALPSRSIQDKFCDDNLEDWELYFQHFRDDDVLKSCDQNAWGNDSTLCITAAVIQRTIHVLYVDETPSGDIVLSGSTFIPKVKSNRKFVANTFGGAVNCFLYINNGHGDHDIAQDIVLILRNNHYEALI